MVKVFPVPALASSTVTPAGNSPHRLKGWMSSVVITDRSTPQPTAGRPTAVGRTGRIWSARGPPNLRRTRRRPAVASGATPSWPRRRAPVGVRVPGPPGRIPPRLPPPPPGRLCVTAWPPPRHRVRCVAIQWQRLPHAPVVQVDQLTEVVHAICGGSRDHRRMRRSARPSPFSLLPGQAGSVQRWPTRRSGRDRRRSGPEPDPGRQPVLRPDPGIRDRAQQAPAHVGDGTDERATVRRAGCLSRPIPVRRPRRPGPLRPHVFDRRHDVVQQRIGERPGRKDAAGELGGDGLVQLSTVQPRLEEALPDAPRSSSSIRSARRSPARNRPPRRCPDVGVSTP